MTDTTTKKRTKKTVDKVADVATEVVSPIAQEQALPKAETVAQPQYESGIELGTKNGITIESKDYKLIVSYPSRKETNFAFSEQGISLRDHTVGWDNAGIENKLFEKENLQMRSVAFNIGELSEKVVADINKAVDKARTFNSEIMADRDTAMTIVKSMLEDRELLVYGIPTRENKNPTAENKDMQRIPSYLTGPIVSAEKHVIAVVELCDDKKAYVRLLETSKLPLGPQEYGDKLKAVRNHLGVKEDNILKQTINDKEHDVVVGVERYIAYTPDKKANIAKVSNYVPKVEQAPVQNKVKKQVPTMAQ